MYSTEEVEPTLTQQPINNMYRIFCSSVAIVQYVHPYFLHKVLVFCKHSPSFYYWEVTGMDAFEWGAGLKFM